jgi:hypothetical protein
MRGNSQYQSKVQGPNQSKVQSPKSKAGSPATYIGPWTLDFGPLKVAAVAVLGYLLILAIFLGPRGDARDFVQIGTSYLERSQASPTIRFDPAYRGYPENRIGYDGQFSYYIALDPPRARYYVGRVAYRYSRIVYPMAAWLLALGQPGPVPLTLILVNLLAIAGGTWAVAAWCRERQITPWLALVYAFFIGQVMAFVRDLNEVLAYALATGAVYAFERGDRGRILAAALFSLALLTRESTAVFPVLYALRALLEPRDEALTRRLGAAGVFGLISIGPYALWQVFLKWWVGGFGWEQATGPVPVPFSGLLELYPFRPDVLEVAQVVVLPGAVCLVVGLWSVFTSSRARRRVEVWAMIANALLFVLLLPAPSLVELQGAARVATGVVLGGIYSLPYVSSRGWLFFCAAIWLGATFSYIVRSALLR